MDCQKLPDSRRRRSGVLHLSARRRKPKGDALKRYWNQQKCCILGCGSTREESQSFRTIPEKAQHWWDAIGNHLRPPSSRPERLAICDLHFEPECFVKSYSKKTSRTLKAGSIPTIFPEVTDEDIQAANNPRTVKNDSTAYIYDCVKVEPPDSESDELSSLHVDIAGPDEIPANIVMDSETADTNFSLEDMQCPVKAKKYFLKVQKELALLKELAQQNSFMKQQHDQLQMPTANHETVVKQEMQSDEEVESYEMDSLKRKKPSPEFQKESYKAVDERTFKEADELDAYARTVAAKLRKMTRKQRMFSENMINQILYNGLKNNLSASKEKMMNEIFCEGLPNKENASTEITEQPQTLSVQSQEKVPPVVQQSAQTQPLNVQHLLVPNVQQSLLPNIHQAPLFQGNQQVQLLQPNQQSQITLPMQLPIIALNLSTPEIPRNIQFQNQILSNPVQDPVFLVHSAQQMGQIRPSNSSNSSAIPLRPPGSSNT